MYSTSIGDNRCLVKCLTVSRHVVAENFIMDTGAKYTCCSYTVIDDALTEDEVADSKVKLIGGLVRGSMVKFYQYRLRQFTIGNIDWGRRISG